MSQNINFATLGELEKGVFNLIYMFTGTPRSGKSYHAVFDVISNLKHGYNVIANFPVDYQRLKIKPKGEFVFLPIKDMTVNYFLNYAIEHHKKSRKVQTIIFVDEAQIKFNSRNFKDKDRLNWINFFSNHGHFNFDIVLITQVDTMIDKQIRGLVETEVRHRRIKNYKAFGAFLSLFVEMFLYVDIWYPCKMKTGSSFHILNKRIADCYDTMALFINSDELLKKDIKKEVDLVDDKKSSEVKKINKSSKQAVLSKSDILPHL